MDQCHPFLFKRFDSLILPFLGSHSKRLPCLFHAHPIYFCTSHTKCFQVFSHSSLFVVLLEPQNQHLLKLSLEVVLEHIFKLICLICLIKCFTPFKDTTNFVVMICVPSHLGSRGKLSFFKNSLFIYL